MSTAIKIKAEVRTEFGKGGARRTRRAGLVPAVVYGHGETPRHIAVSALEFAAAIRRGGANTVFEITTSDGATSLALPKAIQRDPIKDTYEHIDMIIVLRGEQVTVDIPVHVLGTAVSGTLVMVEHDRISINAEALHLPDFVEVSVDGLDAGAHIAAKDLKLPTGVSLAGDPEAVLVVVSHAPTAEQLEGETVTEGAEVAEAETTTEGEEV